METSVTGHKASLSPRIRHVGILSYALNPLYSVWRIGENGERILAIVGYHELECVTLLHLSLF